MYDVAFDPAYQLRYLVLTDLLEHGRGKLDGCISTAGPPLRYGMEHHPARTHVNENKLEP